MIGNWNISKEEYEKMKNVEYSDAWFAENFQSYVDFSNPRYTLARMSNDLEFTASDVFINFCLEKGFIKEKSRNKHFGTIQYQIDWKKVSKLWPKKL